MQVLALNCSIARTGKEGGGIEETERRARKEVQLTQPPVALLHLARPSCSTPHSGQHDNTQQSHPPPPLPPSHLWLPTILGSRCRVPMSAAIPMSTSLTWYQLSAEQYRISHAAIRSTPRGRGGEEEGEGRGGGRGGERKGWVKKGRGRSIRESSLGACAV